MAIHEAVSSKLEEDWNRIIEETLEKERRSKRALIFEDFKVQVQ